jgi:hypothetical protein
MPHSASPQCRQRNFAPDIEPAAARRAVAPQETAVTFKTALLALVAAAAIIGAAIIAVPTTVQKTSEAVRIDLRLR